MFRPLLYRLTPAQTLVVLGSEVVPGVLILLPAATGGIAKALALYAGVAGWDPPAALPAVAALLITSGLAGVSKVRVRGGGELGGAVNRARACGVGVGWGDARGACAHEHRSPAPHPTPTPHAGGGERCVDGRV